MSLDLQRPTDLGDVSNLGQSRSSISDFRRPVGVDPHQIEAEAELRDVLQRLQFSASPITLERLQEIYETSMNEGGGVLPVYSRSTAELIVDVLMLRCSEKTQSMLHPEITPAAKHSMRLFFQFLQHSEQVQDVLETKSAHELKRTLKFERHLKDPDREHVLLAGDLIAYLSTNYPKFANWEAYVPPDAYHLVKESFEDLPKESFELQQPRLSMDSRPPTTGLYYDTTPEDVLKIFNTSATEGLSSVECLERLRIYGKNALPKPKPPGVLTILKHQLMDFMVIILIVAAVLSAALMDYIAAGALIAVVTVNVLIGFTQELKAERALASLASLQIATGTVIRDGEQVQIENELIVPGDIIVLQDGMMISADARIIEVHSLQVDEAILTGECALVSKKVEPIYVSNLDLGDTKNCAFMSTLVAKGRGKAVVVATGGSTEVGKISGALASAKTEKTLLQKKLASLGRILVLIAVVLCLIMFVVGLIRGFSVIDMVHISVSLAVSVIPEGLAIVVTLSFSFAAQSIAKRHAIVRKLPSIESLGSVSVICSDKTGTLTEGKMKCEEVWVAEKKYTVSGPGSKPEGDILNDVKAKVHAHEMSKSLLDAMMVSAVCANAQVTLAGSEWVLSGAPTELAIVVMAQKAGFSKTTFTDGTHGNLEFVSEIPFDSERKRMAVVYQNEGEMVIMMKGAPERVVERCKLFRNSHGEDIPLTAEITQVIEDTGMEMASRGLRVLALGQRTCHSLSDPTSAQEVEAKELTFLGLVGIIDPPREEVGPAVAACHAAGIGVIMITGDHQITASSIAKQLGIMTEEEEAAGTYVRRGVELDALSDEDLASMEPFPKVCARVSPENKLKIVNALKARGEVVAMTGDGVNDAPAIKFANIGIAMGITGTDLTKQSADIILLDDCFATIVAAIEEGRRVYDNIRKFVLYLLSANSAEIWIMLFSITIGLPPPFTSVMILWANIFADIPPALALGVDPAEPDVLSRLPRDPKAGIFNAWTASLVLVQGINMALISAIVYIIALWVEGYEVQMARTLVYATLTSIQLVHAFSSKSVRATLFRRATLNNKWLLGGFCISFICLLFGIYTPGVNSVLELVPFPIWDWLKVVAACICHLAVMEFIKLLFRINASLQNTDDAKFYREI
eukprot:CAMPEP_0114604954 /NCGR_PEP_ID=MMETSP0168-20121206/808_1 /TAXON_ID=95228 ORGANISM="Vannella sp., Strain DIVA3 517/6/12" /NCGR_SAMPLE_ID=MMETSP0168 /ASSEMBLY_ACC=CAM_ASM_000044 /LENGTH=1140 /DNA_ID=CAMNT_0001815795 /DNA_START=203 /DNA_END=3625 /DNA_ORIENTATION=+